MNLNRRQFLGAASAAAFPFIFPAYAGLNVRKYAANEKVNVGVIGIGRISTTMDIPLAIKFTNLCRFTAVCDLDSKRLKHGVDFIQKQYRKLKKEEKKYNFSGPSAYTEILTSGGIDCVTLANNHSHDYDTAGYEDTRRALESAGVTYFSTDTMAVWRNDDGLMIGFLGVSGSLSGNRNKEYKRQAEILRSLGCAAVITVMHTGTEYDYQPDSYQRQVVTRALDCGTDLIVGHHPHVAQGYEIRNGVPVAYSLGNCVFGGNTNPRDHDALVLRAELSFEDGELEKITLRFYPISVSGEESYNDYSPVFLSGADADRVLGKMEDSTGVSPGAFDETNGAVVTVPAGGKD